MICLYHFCGQWIGAIHNGAGQLVPQGFGLVIQIISAKSDA
jgi:hypothetical protein